MRGEALVSVCSIYNPPPLLAPLVLSVLLVILCRFSKDFSFSFRLPQTLLCLSAVFLHPSLPPSLCLSLAVCLPLSPLPALSLCSVNLWQTLLTYPSMQPKTAGLNSEAKENTSVNTTPKTFPFLFWCLPFNFPHLPPSIDKKTSIQTLSHWSSLLIFPLCFWVATSKAQPNQEGRILLHWRVYQGWVS